MFLRILYAEDNRLVYEAVKETFELEGWEIEICPSGFLALEKIKGEIPYDLFLIDNDLPGIVGLELIRVIKSLPHRKHTPIIMLSASNVEHEAKRAGADLFLRKPEDMNLLVKHVTGLFQGV
jgi:CheY-like chemotaxis protein